MRTKRTDCTTTVRKKNSEPTQKYMYHVYQAYRVLHRFTETDNNRLKMTEIKHAKCTVKIASVHKYTLYTYFSVTNRIFQR